MSAFRSNLNSINNNVLQFARHNDTHSDDALEILLTNIYTAVPAAIIVQSGVNYRTTDFQAWAIYYNPEQIFDPAAPNNLEIIDQFASENNFAYTGTYEIYNEIDLSLVPPVGDYLCLTSVDYQNPNVYDVLSAAIPNQILGNVVITDIWQNNTQNGAVIGSLTIVYEVAGILKITTFTGNSLVIQSFFNAPQAPVDSVVMNINQLLTVTGDPLPPHTTTGRYGILLNQYNTTI